MATTNILTKRERQVAQAYVEGLSHKDIAEKLFIAPATVRTHLNNIYSKLDVSTKMQLLRALETSEAQPEASPAQSQAPKKRLARVLMLSAIALLTYAGISLLPTQSNITANSAPPPIQITAASFPSIAVIPFDTLGTAAPEEAFITAVTDDLVTDLSQFSTIFVYAVDTTRAYTQQNLTPREIAQTLGARYYLTGNLQWQSAHVRANVQVSETQTSKVIWAERFEKPAEDVLSLQAQIVAGVVKVIGPVDGALSKLRAAELDRLKRVPTQDLQAYDHFLNGLVLFETYTQDQTAEARMAFDKATAVDPLYGRAHAYAGWAHLQEYRNGWSTEPEASLEAAAKRAEEAIKVDPQDPYGHWALGAVLLYQRRHDLSLAAYRRAVELNPNNAEMLVYLGWALTYAGKPEEGIAYIESAIARNPKHPGWYLWDYAFAYFVAGDYHQAAHILEQRSPKTTGTYSLLAMAYAMQDQKAAADAALRRVLVAAPNTSMEHSARIEPFQHQQDLEHFLEAMRIAGFPNTAPGRAK